MGKYIWPHQLSKAAIWYLEILSGKRKLSVDAIIAEQIQQRVGYRNRAQTRKQLASLVDKGLVTKNGHYQNTIYEITRVGADRLEQLSLKQLVTNSKDWDGKWRLVIFDIPESARRAREQIRRLLKELGFQQLQLSVWIHPLPCLDYFKDIQKAYGIREHLFLIQAGKIEVPSEIIKKFEDLYPNLRLK